MASSTTIALNVLALASALETIAKITAIAAVITTLARLILARVVTTITATKKEKKKKKSDPEKGRGCVIKTWRRTHIEPWRASKKLQGKLLFSVCLDTLCSFWKLKTVDYFLFSYIVSINWGCFSWLAQSWSLNTEEVFRCNSVYVNASFLKIAESGMWYLIVAEIKRVRCQSFAPILKTTIVFRLGLVNVSVAEVSFSSSL